MAQIEQVEMRKALYDAFLAAFQQVGVAKAGFSWLGSNKSGPALKQAA